MNEERTINLVFVTSTGAKKTISYKRAKETVVAEDVVALSDFLIQKKILTYESGEELTGLYKAYLEAKTVTPININI